MSCDIDPAGCHSHTTPIAVKLLGNIAKKGRTCVRGFSRSWYWSRVMGGRQGREHVLTPVLTCGNVESFGDQNGLTLI